MLSATARFGLWAALLALLATPAWAQQARTVTFQVNMNDAIQKCVFNPAAEGAYIAVRGNFNRWGQRDAEFRLTDDNNDGIYTGTFSSDTFTTVADDPDAFDPATGRLFFKFWGTGDVGWENDPNREATLGTESLVLDPVPFRKNFNNACGVVREEFEIEFRVDMSVQRRIGRFNPDQNRVYVSGEFNGWQAASPNYELTEDVAEADVYVGVFRATLAVPSSNNPYKFTIDGEYESGPDRTFSVTGDETDSTGDGRREVLVPQRFFDDIDASGILDAPATVRIEVDLRPAYYRIADAGSLPGDGAVTTITGLFINGPIAANSNEDTASQTWVNPWSPEGLGQIATRRFQRASETDSIYVITYTYPRNSPNRIIGKLSVNGYDNESGFQEDRVITITEGEQTIRMVFGCVRRADGTYLVSNLGGPSPPYGPYLQIVNDGLASTCTVVRRAGTVGVEPTGRTPEGFVLKGAYPNPAFGTATFEYAMPRAGHVRLEVFDLMGRRVATLVDAVQPADTYRVGFDVGALAPGTYLYRLTADGQTATQRLTVVR